MPLKLHPISVHFPIAFIILAGGLYIFYLFKPEFFYFKAAKLVHLLGVIGLILAMLTGRSAASEIEAESPLTDLVRNHEILGYGAIWAFSMLLVWSYLREKNFKQKELIFFCILYTVFLAGMIYSSYLGGEISHQ
ncbi:MAG: DUF2231 domain-containing protein [Bacteroidota bacterium]